jgi:hypothetical protein
MDSLSEADGYLNQLWKDRRAIQTLVVANSLQGKLALAALPRLERLKRKLWPKQPQPELPVALGGHEAD